MAFEYCKFICNYIFANLKSDTKILFLFESCLPIMSTAVVAAKWMTNRVVIINQKSPGDVFVRRPLIGPFCECFYMLRNHSVHLRDDLDGCAPRKINVSRPLRYSYKGCCRVFRRLEGIASAE